MSTWLRRLLDATTLPPQTDDIDALLAAFEQMTRERQLVIDDAPRMTDHDDRAALRAELAARHAAWQLALTAAHRRVGDQRRGMAQARRYQRAR